MAETNSQSPLEIVTSLPGATVDVRDHAKATVEAQADTLTPAEAIQIGAPAIKAIEGPDGAGWLTLENGDRVQTVFEGPKPKKITYKINTGNVGGSKAA